MAMNISSGGGGRKGRQRRRAPMAEINVTPLVDVMLVLLIIFMVTAPLLNTGVPVELPETRANALDQKKDPVEISVDRVGQIFIDGEAVSERELPARLETIAGGQTEEEPRQILLRGDTSVDYGKVMTVMGELNRVGLNNISMVTSPVTRGSSETR